LIVPAPSLRRVVKTKIMPPLRRVGLLHRERLIDFLHDNVNRKLLLISASPGYGKTSLLIDFIQDTDLPTCWYAMDSSDGDPWNFITYLAASIAETFPEMAQAPVLAGADQEQDLQSLLQALVNGIQELIDEYFVVLIDDFQFASTNETILELVNWFLDHQPDNCCIVLASRVMPDLPYLRLTAKQEIAGLGSEDLAFTPEEIQAYLAQNHKLQIPIEEARQLATETEGWITGILLGTHTLWKGLIRSITAAKARDEQIFDYMAQEIFNQQPDEIKRFLKATSILHVMTPGFCNRMLEITNAEQLLERLETANLFVLRLSGEEKTYRYHALFQDFLRKQFEPDGLAEKSTLHKQAGRMRLAEGNWEVALEHFLACGSDEDAIAVIKDQMESVYRAGRLVTLNRWLDALDPRSLSSDPSLLIMRGRLYRQEGEFDQALASYEQARSLYVDHGDRKGELGVQIHEALVHRYCGAMEKARDMAEGALSRADAQVVDPAMSAQAHRILGEYHYLSGELERAKREFRLSLNLYEQIGDRYHKAALLQALGTTARLMGNPLEAEGHYLKALSILKKLGNRWRIAEMQNNIGVGYYYQGEYDKALKIFLQALAEAREVGHKRTEALILASLGDLYADIREVGEAQRYYEASLEGVRATNDQLLEVYNLCAMANLYRVDQAWEHAFSLLAQADRLSGSEESGYLTGLVALSKGMVLHDQSQLKQANKALEGAIRMLMDAGEQRELTKAHLWQANTLFRLEKLEEAYAQLNMAMQLSRQIKHPHLLVVDGSRMIPFLERAKVEGGIDGVDQLLIRIHQFNLSMVRGPVRKIYSDITSPRVEVITFGEATVKVDGKAIARNEWKGPLVKELFLYLLENEPVRREVILDVFWPEYSTAKAQSIFHASLYRMRRILPKGLIRYDNEQGVYLIEKGIDHWYDVRAFSDLVERAHAVGEPEDLLEQAASIYHGEYLPSIYSDWCLERREVYQRNFVEALTALASLKVKRGRFDEAVSWYRRAVEVEPFQEELHRHLMQALSDAGRRREALRQYEELVSLLETEMNLPPAKETKALFDRIQKMAKAPR
jgi:LuxR family maltose regulon positive regulatory protein